MDAKLLEAVRKRDRADQERRDRILIWPDMVAPVCVFLAMDTQWRTGPYGIRTGLDYTAIDSVIRHLNLSAFTPEDFRDIRLMEQEALRVWRSKR